MSMGVQAAGGGGTANVPVEMQGGVELMSVKAHGTFGLLFFGAAMLQDLSGQSSRGLETWFLG